MKIGIYATNNTTYPTPDDVIFANVSIAGELADGLVDQGQEVAFFAPEGTKTKAELVSFDMLPFSDPKIYSRYPDKNASYQYEDLMVVKALNYMADNKFDIFHTHTRPLSVVKFAALKPELPTVVTVHDPLTYPAYDILPRYNEFKNLFFVSLTDAQRQTRPDLHWKATVHNGVDLEYWKFNPSRGVYLLFVGRLMPEKGVDLAVQIAREAGLPLKIAGSIYDDDRPFFEEKVKPHLGAKIEYLGLLPRVELVELYAGALALLAPVRWSEPFGLVFAEAMACGTPVVAANKGSVPEIVADGKTGIIVKGEGKGSFVRAVKKISLIDRRDCRKHVEENFSLERMAREYSLLYNRLAENSGLEARELNANGLKL